MHGLPSAFGEILLGGGHPDHIALRTADSSLTYEQLRGLVAHRQAELGLDRRSVVMLHGEPSVEFVVSYVALLRGGHVPLLAGERVDRLDRAWRPAAVIRATADGCCIERHAPERRTLHPALRLLMSTSGSTGSPKLVRLSDQNLLSNASSIVQYLGLRAADVGITTLPLHYCYGLSVLHSHLVAGASIVLESTSVVDPCFAAVLHDHGVTNVAGVPYTFEMLDRVGPDRLHVPTLRFVTQAGGRLDPEGVAGWVQRTNGWGAEFFVMYGQTEATARMAYVPPGLAGAHPRAIGVPIPGGHLELRALGGLADDVGELIYRGPNVMLGYARDDADLAAGAALAELSTGDIARFHADTGLFELVGRRARFVKPFGLRIDLDDLERELQRSWLDVAVAGDDHRVVVAAPGADAGKLCRAARRHCGLPDSMVHVEVARSIPRTEAGKVDYGSVLRWSAAGGAGSDGGPNRAAAERRGAQTPTVAEIYAAVLGRDRVGSQDTFVSLGGDSLSYVECSLRLEQAVGDLPHDWHLRQIGEFGPSRSGRRWPRFDTSALLRAIGILAVVATHMGVLFFPGGSHLMLAVVGFNASRFLLDIEPAGRRIVAGARTVARVATPTVLWVGVGMLVFGSYSTGTLLLVNNYVGAPSHADDHWHFWFIEVFVHITVATLALLAIPSVRRTERCYPYAFPFLLLLGCLLLRMEWARMDDWYNLRFRTHGVAWFFVLGWLVHRSRTFATKAITTMVCLLAVPGFFALAQREWFIASGLVLLTWIRAVPMPRIAIRPVSAISAASMWIYISHFSLWPPLEQLVGRDLAYPLTILSGVVVCALVGRAGLARRALRWREAPPSSRPSRELLGDQTGDWRLKGGVRCRVSTAMGRR